MGPRPRGCLSLAVVTVANAVHGADAGVAAAARFDLLAELGDVLDSKIRLRIDSVADDDYK